VKLIVLIVDGNSVVVLAVSNMLDEDAEGELLIVLNEGNKVDIVSVTNEFDILGVELVWLVYSFEIEIVFIVFCWVFIGIEEKVLTVFVDVDGIFDSTVWVVKSGSGLVMVTTVTGEPDTSSLDDIVFIVLIFVVDVEPSRIVDSSVTWEWLSRVLNISGKFVEVDEVLEYSFGLVYSCDEKSGDVDGVTWLVAIDSYVFSLEVW